MWAVLSVWVPSRSLLPQSKNMQVRLTGHTKLIIGVNVSVCVVVSLDQSALS